MKGIIYGSQFLFCSNLAFVWVWQYNHLLLPGFWCLVFSSAPNADNVLVMRTPDGVFSTKSVLHSQNQEQWLRGSRLVSSKNAEYSDTSVVGDNEIEPVSAARCRVFTRSGKKVSCLCIFALHIFKFQCLPTFIQSHLLMSFVHLPEESARASLPPTDGPTSSLIRRDRLLKLSKSNIFLKISSMKVSFSEYLFLIV